MTARTMIIAQSGVKRVLDTSKPFMLCISRDDAKMLVDQLQSKAGDDWCYGWVTIYPFTWIDGTAPNTRPLLWDEPGNVNPPI